MLTRCIAFGSILLSAICFALSAFASSTVEVKSTVCEKLINGESRSSARVRALDKASFKAVEEASPLAVYRSKLDTQNFNLKVYQLVDNYLDDVQISTTSQSNDQVCVEVIANLSEDKVTKVFSQSENDKTSFSDVEDIALEIENDLEENISIAIPPKPEIVINKKISYTAAEEEPVQPKQIVVSQTKTDDKKAQKTVFIDKTEFYDGTTTSGFFSQMEQAVVQKTKFRADALLNNPDYILKTKVLKAKVDNVNAKTSRMQVVVSLELTDTQTSEVMTEHQNRFVLFNSIDNPKQTATIVTGKLFEAGIEKLFSKIKDEMPKTAASSSIITPN